MIIRAARARLRSQHQRPLSPGLTPSAVSLLRANSTRGTPSRLQAFTGRRREKTPAVSRAGFTSPAKPGEDNGYLPRQGTSSRHVADLKSPCTASALLLRDFGRRDQKQYLKHYQNMSDFVNLKTEFLK